MIGGVKVDHYRGNLNGQLLSSRLVIAIVVEGASCSHTHISLDGRRGLVPDVCAEESVVPASS
jgi:hypothetical protein